MCSVRTTGELEVEIASLNTMSDTDGSGMAGGEEDSIEEDAACDDSEDSETFVDPVEDGNCSSPSAATSADSFSSSSTAAGAAEAFCGVSFGAAWRRRAARTRERMSEK